MTVSITEDEKFYSVEIIDVKNNDDWINIIQSFINDTKTCVDKISCKVFLDGEVEGTFSEIDNVIANCRVKLDSLFDELDESKSIKITCQKKEDECLYIVSPIHFVSFIKSTPRIKQIKFWLNDININFNKININHIYSDLNYSLEVGSVDCIARNKTKALSSIIDIDKLDIEHLNYLMSIFCSCSVIIDLIVETRTLLSLALIARETKIEKGSFIFENERELLIDDASDGFLLNHGELIYTIYNWTYSDERLSARLGIVNHVIAQYQSLEDAFTNKLIDVLDSNYQVYIKENFEQYIEVKLKISDLLYEFSNKINDRIGEVVVSTRNTTLLVLSYFFSIIVFTAIDKGKVNNLFNFEISLLSSVFILAAIVNNVVLYFDLQRVVNFYQNQLSEASERYGVFLGQNEVNSILSSDSLSNVILESRKKRNLICWSFILVILLISLWTLYSMKVNDAVIVSDTKAKTLITGVIKDDVKPPVVGVIKDEVKPPVAGVAKDEVKPPMGDAIKD